MRPDVGGAALLEVDREFSLKGKIPLGAVVGGVVLPVSPCLLYLFLLTEAVAAGSHTGQLSPVSRQ